MLQAFVSEGLKPYIDGVVTFGAGHFYVSQSDKGGLVFGGDIDGYNSYAQRGNLPMVEHVVEARHRPDPVASRRVRVLRSWGGIMDMSMDGSPIIDKTHIDGLYLNAGWCYGGFKATPASGWCFATPSPRTNPTSSTPPIVSTGSGPATCSTKRARAPHRTCTDGSQHMLIPCPHCGTRPVEEFTFLGDAAAHPPHQQRSRLDGAWYDYVYLRDNPRGRHRGIWHHSGGCRSWLVVSRNTETHEVFGAVTARDFAKAQGRRRHDLLSSRQGRPRSTARRPSASPSTASASRGRTGDTLASALLANGVTLMGRSFKYHRPRGVITAGAAEPNALVELREGGRKEANTRATMIELYDGLVAKSQNRWPSLNFDIGAVNSLASSIFVAGFYYKTFMWPKSFWEKIYEPIIRRAAGLGTRLEAARPGQVREVLRPLRPAGDRLRPHRPDGGAGRRPPGKRVILADEGSRARRLAAERAARRSAARPGFDWAQGVIAELGSMPNVTLMPRTTIIGWFDGNVFGAVERVSDHVRVPDPYEPRQRYWQIHRQARRAGGGCGRAPRGLRRQRHAGRDDGLRHAHLCQPLRGGGGPLRRRLQQQ